MSIVNLSPLQPFNFSTVLPLGFVIPTCWFSCPPLAGGPKSSISRRGNSKAVGGTQHQRVLKKTPHPLPLSPALYSESRLTRRILHLFALLRKGRGRVKASCFTRRKADIRIIRDVGKAWFSDTLRAGFALAHSAPFRKSAFTLAEVLITLGIIGVVAAMTLPSTVAKYKDKVLVSQAKKLYSETMNGIKLYTAKNNCADASCLFDTSKNTDEVNREFFKVLEGATYCGQGNKKDVCQKYMVLSNKKINNGYGQTGYGDNISQPFIVLKTGSIIKIIQYSQCIREYEYNLRDENGNFVIGDDGQPEKATGTTDSCAYIYLDSNGQKGPNQKGADVFRHTFNSNGKINIDSLFKKVLTEDKIEYSPYNVGVEY